MTRRVWSDIEAADKKIAEFKEKVPFITSQIFAGSVVGYALSAPLVRQANQAAIKIFGSTGLSTAEMHNAFIASAVGMTAFGGYLGGRLGVRHLKRLDKNFEMVMASFRANHP